MKANASQYGGNKLVLIGFGVALLIFLMIGGFSYWTTKEFIEVDQSLMGTYNLLRTLESVKNNLKDSDYQST